MKRVILGPPPKLQSLVRYFHVEAADAGEVLLPAVPFPIVTVFISGATVIEVAPGQWDATPAEFLAGPTSRATRYRTAPGTVFISVLLHAGRLPHLFGIPAHHLADARWPLAEVADAALVDHLVERLRAQSTPRAWVDLLSDWIALRAAAHEGADLSTRPLTVTEAFDDPQRLALRHGLGVRQFERRFLATYGQSLRDMRRITRFVNALAALMSGRHARGGLAGLASDCGYFDQPHMVRDFAVLAGTSPRRIAREASTDPVLSVMHYPSSELEFVLGKRERSP